MDIRFVSTLTAEDEERVADALLGALVALLEDLPITYALRIETIGSKVFQQSNVTNADPLPTPPEQVALPAVPSAEPVQ